MRYLRSTSSYTELVGDYVRNDDKWNVIRGVSILERNPKLVYKNMLGGALLLLLNGRRKLFVEYNKIEIREIQSSHY